MQYSTLNHAYHDTGYHAKFSCSTSKRVSISMAPKNRVVLSPPFDVELGWPVFNTALPTWVSMRNLIKRYERYVWKYRQKIRASRVLLVMVTEGHRNWYESVGKLSTVNKTWRDNYLWPIVAIFFRIHLYLTPRWGFRRVTALECLLAVDWEAPLTLDNFCLLAASRRFLPQSSDWYLEYFGRLTFVQLNG